MISKEEIKKLAGLARIDIGDEEIENLRGDMDSILDYVGQVSGFASNSQKELDFGQIHNVFREDENPNESESYSKELIAEFPRSEKNYLKVKKIL
jgi:aspartyl-tRNA(Asn)/glutamyl-tRNA(Gln) amidotransferase subunit C